MTSEFFQNRHGMEKHEACRHPLFARAMDELYWPHPCEKFHDLDRKELLYTEAANAMPEGPMTYLEFGVYGGWSFERILKEFPDPGARFYGFDSFKGLPERWAEKQVGHFSTDGETPDPGDDRAKFIKGWFQNTVPGFLADNPISGPVLVHFDADLYSSTLFLLSILWQYVPDYWFIFDEFQPDEIIAMHDFSRAYPVEMQFLACTANEIKVPQQILGRLRNVEFEP